MKILLEQEEYLKVRLKKLHDSLNSLRESKISDSTGRFEEFMIKENDILTVQAEMNRLQQILTSAEVVRNFNNEQIDVGTSFKVKFQDSDEEMQLVMVETTLDGGFGSKDGYITKESLFGKAIYLKEASSLFSYEIQNNQMVSGQIVEIIPKKSIDIKPERRKSKNVESVSDFVHYDSSALNKPCRQYTNYVSKLKKYEKYNENVKSELARLSSITPSQYQYLKEAYQKLLKEKNPYRSDYRSICKRLEKISKHLGHNIITDTDLSMIDFGTQMILEVLIDGKKTIQNLEFVPYQYYSLNNYADQCLSIRNYIGYELYKAQMGDSFHFNKTNSNPEQTVRVAQFNIHPERLLLPTSSNLSSYRAQERMASIFRLQYQKENHSMMTLSQKELFDLEFSKIAYQPQITPYITWLQSLKQRLDHGNIQVQSEELLMANGDSIHLGSKVEYAFLKNGELEEKTVEMISCAFTTEENDQYVEEFTPLGKSLMGKHQNDYFEVEQDGMCQKGIILSVSNTPNKEANLGGENYDTNTRTKNYIRRQSS